MANRADDIRKRHAERKKKRIHAQSGQKRPIVLRGNKENDAHGFPGRRKSTGSGGDSPVIRKEGMIFRVMIAAILFLAVGILFKQPTPAFDGAKGFVKQTF
ncbi:MAG TPA: hypothetical protein VFK27_06475, partial [Bacillales bacterium]|nr:hypothetical protein [Bacillales bacterium]